jgi:hypothetical protein
MDTGAHLDFLFAKVFQLPTFVFYTPSSSTLHLSGARAAKPTMPTTMNDATLARIGQVLQILVTSERNNPNNTQTTSSGANVLMKPLLKAFRKSIKLSKTLASLRGNPAAMQQLRMIIDSYLNKMYKNPQDRLAQLGPADLAIFESRVFQAVKATIKLSEEQIAAKTMRDQKKSQNTLTARVTGRVQALNNALFLAAIHRFINPVTFQPEVDRYIIYAATTDDVDARAQAAMRDQRFPVEAKWAQVQPQPLEDVILAIQANEPASIIPECLRQQIASKVAAARNMDVDGHTDVDLSVSSD